MQQQTQQQLSHYHLLATYYEQTYPKHTQPPENTDDKHARHHIRSEKGTTYTFEYRPCTQTRYSDLALQRKTVDWKMGQISFSEADKPMHSPDVESAEGPSNAFKFVHALKRVVVKETGETIEVCDGTMASADIVKAYYDPQQRMLGETNEGNLWMFLNGQKPFLVMVGNHWFEGRENWIADLEVLRPNDKELEIIGLSAVALEVKNAEGKLMNLWFDSKSKRVVVQPSETVAPCSLIGVSPENNLALIFEKQSQSMLTLPIASDQRVLKAVINGVLQSDNDMPLPDSKLSGDIPKTCLPTEHGFYVAMLSGNAYEITQDSIRQGPNLGI